MDFAASADAGESLDRLNQQLSPPLPVDQLTESFRLEFLPGRAGLAVHAVARDARLAEQRADALAAHAAGFATEWIGQRTTELDTRILIVERRLHELRKRFADFDATFTAGDLRSLQQTLEKELSERSAKAEAFRTQLGTVEIEERKLISSATMDQPALRALEQELQRALTRFTDQHPQVKELRLRFAALEKDSAVRIRVRVREPLADINERRDALRAQLEKAEGAESKSSAALRTFATNAIEFTRAQSEFAALTSRRDGLIQARVAMANKGVNLLRPSGRITLARISDRARLGNYTLVGAFAGLGLAGVVLAISRRRSRIIRDARGLEQATGLPVLAELPPLANMNEAEREYWAVETLERLRGAVPHERRGCFVCGIISANSGEGRSTWIDLLAKAGLRNGQRVLVISQPRGEALLPETNSSASVADKLERNSTSLFVPAVAAPDAISRYSLTAAVSHAQFHENWERAFVQWRQEENAIVLVELPPANTAEALLQSRSVPNVLWLGAAHVAESSKTLRCVAGLRNTGCNLIGAALNMCSASTRRWMVFLLMLVVSFGSALAQSTNEAISPPITNALSRTKTPVLDPWQQKLTLGPGDVFDISLYGQPDSGRAGLSIAPDGRLSYLQATDFVATGLTVDELRAKLEEVLGQFHLSPRVVIVPQTFRSKKYFVLGNVAQRGVFTLDRPTTVLEAVAKARGFVTGGAQRSTFNLADLSHSFLMRRQTDGGFTREPVDFEGLFKRGELQHNKLLAPDDYLYFPPLGLEEVYVLGEVRGVGIAPYVKNLTALGAIASKGGFTEGAFRQRILIVRGSLEKPETFIVDLQETLRAQSQDFLLEPRDIVYVSRKPWAKAQELLEGAASDFVRAVAITWAGQNIGSR